jgi:uncharacterized protein DUF3175
VTAVARARPKRRGRAGRRWVRRVTTESTYPPPKTFSGSAQQIARTMASRRVSPKGLGSGIRMIQYFINRGGRKLSPSRRRALERAKRILQEKNAGRKRRRSKRGRAA